LEQVRRLGELGVAQIICLDEENTHHAIGERLRLARGRPLRNLLVSGLPAEMNGMARSILLAAAAVVAEGGQTGELARVVAVTPRTLLRWCRRAGLPPPKQLLAWLRMMLAAELLDDPGRAVLDVALACGYAADSSMRHAMRNFLATSPTALRERGAFQTAARAFVAALHDARITERRYRRDRSAKVVPAHRQRVLRVAGESS
jgi:AraC-like DNA-binding protein